MATTREELEAELDAILAKNRQAFMGQYKDEIDALLGLSREEIDAITLGVTDLEAYDNLIEIVKDASRQNISQASLKSRIESLGDVAVTIAKLVPQLANIFS